MKVVTDTGFECEINEKIVNKYSFLKLVARIEKEPLAVLELNKLLLGEQEEALIEHLGGDPDAEEVAKEITCIINSLGQNTNAKKS